MDDQEKFVVNYDYRRNSSRNFIAFDLTDFQVYFSKKNNCLCPQVEKNLFIKYDFWDQFFYQNDTNFTNYIEKQDKAIFGDTFHEFKPNRGFQSP